MTWRPWRFDGDLLSWEAVADGPEPGPAGIVALELDGWRLHVDAWSGRLLSLLADSPDGSGRVPAAVAEVLGDLVGAPPGPGQTPCPAPEAEVDLSRWVRAVDGARTADAFGRAAGPWREEADELAKRLGLGGGAGGGAVGGAGGGTGGGRAPLLDREGAIERLRTTPHDLGRVPATDGAVALDPSTLPPGLLDLSSGGRVTWTSGTARSLRLEVPVAADVASPRISRLMAVVLDGDDLVAAEVLSVPGAAEAVTGRPSAAASLVLASRRRHQELGVVITSVPPVAPSAALRGWRAARHLARTAAVAWRLGDPQTAVLLRSMAVHRSGRTIGLEIAALPEEPPFRGDLAI